MNKILILIILFIIWFINEFVFFIIDSLILAKSIWTTKAIKILFYIFYSFSCIRLINMLTIIIMHKFEKFQKFVDIMIVIFVILFFVFVLFWILELVIISINFKKYKEYWKNCPFVISDLEYKKHIRRRCELYNINSNNRYSYQYICSYDSSKDFKKFFLEQNNKYNKIICIPLNTNIKNNMIVNEFYKEYKSEKKYYCSRTNKPQNYSYAKSNDCNDTKYRYMLLFVILPFLRILFLFWPYFTVLLLPEDRIRRNRNFYFDNLDISRKSTNISEISREIVNFEKEKTKNIIILNKEEFIINKNIKNLETKDQNDKNHNNINNDLFINKEINVNENDFSIHIYNDGIKSQTELNDNKSDK